MRGVGLVLALLGAGCNRAATPSAPVPAPVPTSAPLAIPAEFAAIADRDARAIAIFTEAGKVLQHPRCLNCHPADDRPRQRDGEAHEPPVVRGAADRGAPVLECTSCHQTQNAPLARVPGAPGWRLAPRSMAWRGRTLAELCLQLKDRQRNGGRTLAQVVEHSTHDPLVGWGWSPGADREPAPGTQQELGALLAAWVDAGAACPPAETETRR